MRLNTSTSSFAIEHEHYVSGFQCFNCEFRNCCGMLSQKKGGSIEWLRRCLPLGKRDSSKKVICVLNDVNDNRLNNNNKRDNGRHPPHAQTNEGPSIECIDYGAAAARNSNSTKDSGLRRMSHPTQRWKLDEDNAGDDSIIRQRNRLPVQRRKLSLDFENRRHHEVGHEVFEMKPMRRSLSTSKRSNSNVIVASSMDSLHQSLFSSPRAATASSDKRTSKMVAKQPDFCPIEQPSGCSQRRRVFVEIGPDARLGISLVGRRRSRSGVFVGEVLRGSPAERVGRIQTGDQITAINGFQLNDLNSEEALKVLRSQLERSRAVVLDVMKTSSQGAGSNNFKPMSCPDCPSLPAIGNQRRWICRHSGLHTIPEEKGLEVGTNAVLTRLDPYQRRRHSLPNQKTVHMNFAMTTAPRQYRRCTMPSHYSADVSIALEQTIEPCQLRRYVPSNHKTDSLPLRHCKPNDLSSFRLRRKSSQTNLAGNKSKRPTFPEKKLFRGEILLMDLCGITRAATELTDLRKYVTIFVKGLLASGRLVRILNNHELYQNADVRMRFSSEAFYQFTRLPQNKNKSKVIAVC